MQVGLAAVEALESAGFALPEPIYRLRFDESAPGPLSAITQTAAKPRRKRKSNPEPKGHDITPDAHVEQPVNEECAESATQDLLDSRRPIE